MYKNVKEVREIYQNPSEEEKDKKSVNMLMTYTEIFRKKNKKRSANMVVRDIKNFKRMKNKG